MENKKVKVSFVMPWYRSEFVHEAVDSILRQTVSELELLIYNTGGNEYQPPKDKRIRIFDAKDWTPAKCYNYAICGARSKYVLIAHDDDVYFPERAMITLHWLQKGYDYVAGSCLMTDKPRHHFLYERLKKFNIQWHRQVANMVSLPFVGFNRGKVPFFREDLPICHDYLFTLECARRKLTIKTLEIPFGEKRIWGDTLYYNKNRKQQVRAELKVIRKLLNDPEIRKHNV